LFQHDLIKTWDAIRCSTLEQAHNLQIGLNVKIGRGDRCLSPSDFGFHNALRLANGQLRFIDFEYAGWDDPAKMVCDFFANPGFPVPKRYLNRAIKVVSKGVAHPKHIRQRIQLLMAVYQIKWCCIMLNEFLPVGMVRRLFSQREEIKRVACESS